MKNLSLTLNNWSVDEAEHYIKKMGFFKSDSLVTRFSSAGDGNMNFTFRASYANGNSIILKQAPPYCAKFKEIPAPLERLTQENFYYQIISKSPLLLNYSPRILGFDPEANIMFMEDLGNAVDYENLYSGSRLTQNEFESLFLYLSELHSLPVDEISMTNQKMRDLNHQYIFVLPFKKEIAIDLNAITPGLNRLAEKVYASSSLKNIAHEVGKLYLEKKDCLIHGDFYPKSWLNTQNGLKVIDPEFGHIGCREFDIGVFRAHMMMCEQDELLIQSLDLFYQKNNSFDQKLSDIFCSFEVLRRILYVSQVPLRNNLEFKDALITKALNYL